MVHVVGEIDIANSSNLEERLEAAATHGRVVIVNLGLTTFFDASGLSALLSGRTAAISRGGSLLLADVPTFLQRLLTITSLDATLTSVPTSGRSPER